MTSTFDAFWNEHARHACPFNNMFLGAIPDAAKEILIAQYGSDGHADNESGPQHIAAARQTCRRRVTFP